MLDITYFYPTEEEVKNLKNQAKEVTRENFVEFIESIASHPCKINAHNQWYKIDDEWKQAKKDYAKKRCSREDVLALAALTREAYKIKDEVHDFFAYLADEATENLGIIENITGETLGTATKVSEVEELSVDWHNLRRGGIGGSSLSKSLGLHWMSSIGNLKFIEDDELDDLWINMMTDKSTEVIHANVPDHGVLLRGHLWEPALIARFGILNNIRVGVSKATWEGKSPLQRINTDGLILDAQGVPEGLLECKTSSREWTWEKGVPVNYKAQVLWYLQATGLKYAYVLVKFDSGTFDSFKIEADDVLDSVDYRKTIDDILPIMSDRWDSYKHYLDEDIEELWDVNQRLHDEFEHQVGENDIDDVILDDKFMQVTVHLLAPYDRMPDDFTHVDYVEVSYGTDKNQHTDIIKTNLSPVFYERATIDQEATSVEGDDAAADKIDALFSDVLDTEPDTQLIASDNATYDFLNAMGFESMNASALRRINDVAPGREDFSSHNEAYVWLKDKAAESID